MNRMIYDEKLLIGIQQKDFSEKRRQFYCYEKDMGRFKCYCLIK